MAMALCQWSGVAINTASQVFGLEQTAMVAEGLRAGRLRDSLIHAIAEDIAHGAYVHLAGLLKNGRDVEARSPHPMRPN